MEIPNLLECFSLVTASTASTMLGSLLLSQSPAEAALLVEKFNATSTVQNLNDADALINGVGVSSIDSAFYDVINFTDISSDFGKFDNDLPWPGVSSNEAFVKNSSENNHFAARITGYIHIPETDVWTFGTTNDDGMRLSIDSQPLIVDDSLHPNRTFLESVYLEQGTHSLELVFFEWINTAALELFAAQGDLNTFNDDFRLVGDTTNGGLSTGGMSTKAVPEASSVFGLVALSAVMFGKRNRGYQT